MPPKLTKSQQALLTKRQAGKVQKSEDKVQKAKDAVVANADQRNNQRNVVGTLRKELGGLQQKLDVHPLCQNARDKMEQISVAKTDLEAMNDDLDDAKTRLEKVSAQHSEIISAVKQELEPPDEDSDDDDD